MMRFLSLMIPGGGSITKKCLYINLILKGDEVNVDMPVGEKHEQSAKEREVNASVEDSVAPTTIEEITLAQTLIQIKAAKPKVEPSEFRTPQESQPSMFKDKGKAIMIKPEVPLKRKDQVALDEDLARNLQAQLEMRRVNTFIPMDSEVVKSKKETEESSKGIEDELESDKSKNVESSEEKAKMRQKEDTLKDDDIAIDAIPLATKLTQ
ncbi:hypothetical protein Tco_0052948 [Tanacetum coccineum]